MQTILRKLAIGSLLALSISPTASAQQAPAEPVIYLDQAWSQEDREWYYQFSQGSTVLSYDIFLNLEVAGGQELFRSDANSDRYGLIPQKANPRFNPEGFRLASPRLRWVLVGIRAEIRAIGSASHAPPATKDN